MIVTVFRSRIRPDLSPDVVAEIDKRGARMYELATKMPGFLSYKDFTSEDGETVTIVEFDTDEHSAAWGRQPEHREVQQWGRDAVFSAYQVQVCEQIRVSRFPR